MDALNSTAGNVASAGREPPLITVAICTRNRARFLREAIESVAHQITSDAEILLIDNASTDNTPEIVRSFATAHPRITAYCEEKLGLSAARNTALRLARGQYVVFLDDDAVAEPGWLEAYRDCFKRPPVPLLAGAGGAVFPRYDGPRPAWIPPGANLLNWSDKPASFSERGGPWGCNFAVDREQALALGGFNLALGRKGAGMGAHEETELFWKLKQTGRAFWWLPAARIQHHVAGHRLTFWAQCRDAFCAGRFAARYRLELLSGGWGRRTAFRLGRALVCPLQCALGLGTAVLMLPFRPLHKPASFVYRAARDAGFGFQALTGAGEAAHDHSR
ncbi:MAG TPA: glycosyltransferase [Verrucomicrobiae bacterium]|nr:glycosyltransferase [Verrucomicrobiae bacterium]